MLILKGTKTVDLSKDELTEIIGQFDRVHIDLGTGDGRNIYIYDHAFPRKAPTGNETRLVLPQ